MLKITILIIQVITVLQNIIIIYNQKNKHNIIKYYSYHCLIIVVCVLFVSVVRIKLLTLCELFVNIINIDYCSCF